jgi:hypothetical protein
MFGGEAIFKQQQPKPGAGYKFCYHRPVIIAAAGDISTAVSIEEYRSSTI